MIGPQEESDRAQRAALYHRTFGPALVEQRASDLGGDNEADKEVEQEDTGLGRRVPQRDLRVFTGEEEHRNEHQHAHEQHEVLHQERPIAEDANRDKRRLGAQFDEPERHQQRYSRGDGAAGGRASPSPDVGLLETEHAQPDSRRHQGQASVVQPGRTVLGVRAADCNQQQGNEGDRDVDPEDGPPRPLRQVTTEDRANGGEAAGHPEEQGQGAAAFSQAEGAHHDGERGRVHDCSAGALQSPRSDYPCLGCTAFGRQAAQTRGHREHHDAEDNHPTMAQNVGEPSAQREQCRQRQQIGVHRPLKPGARQP